MIRRVVDASVATKWFIPEQFSSEALLLRTSADDLIAPDIMVLELARVLLKKVRRGELSPATAREPIQATMAEVVEFHSLLEVLPTAIEIGLTHQRDSYDSVYVALALQERCTLVTANRVLYDALMGAYPDTMIWVGDLPQLLDPASASSPT